MTVSPSPPADAPVTPVATPRRPTVFDITGDLPAPGTTTLLEASAGTGKTWTIAALVTRLVAEGRGRLEEMLVVTFGRAASQELRERVRAPAGRGGALPRRLRARSAARRPRRAAHPAVRRPREPVRPSWPSVSTGSGWR